MERKASKKSTAQITPVFKIGKTSIGGDQPCFIVAEIGINYDGDKEKALRMIDVAADAGCSAVKFQLFRAQRMYAKDAGKLTVASGDIVDIHDLIKKMELSYDWLTELKKYTEKKELEFFSSVCDESSADILEKLNVSTYKTASYEITHLPLIQHIAKKGKPVIISSGGATIMEIDEALQVARDVGQKKLVLMHCIAEYNAPLSTLNLNVLTTLKNQYPEIIIGYSDHSSDPVIGPTAAVVLGAKMIEKHITLDRKSPGPDHSFALEPDELKKMVKAIRKAEQDISTGLTVSIDPRVLGSSKCTTLKNEEYVRKFAYRMVYATKPIKRGEVISSKNIAVLRAGESYKRYYGKGLHPRYYFLLTGAAKYKATKEIKVGQAVTWDTLLTQ